MTSTDHRVGVPRATLRQYWQTQVIRSHLEAELLVEERDGRQPQAYCTSPKIKLRSSGGRLLMATEMFYLMTHE